MRKLLRQIVLSVLTFEARMVLARGKPKIFVITGSVGKTSTKDAVYSALSTSFDVRKSEKSYNSEIGVPLTILNLKNAWDSPIFWLLNIFKGFWELIKPGIYPTHLVLEVGADKPGDLKEIFSWLIPDVVVVTRLPKIPVHVEFYDSPEQLMEEESIPAFKIKKGGVLVLNRDDENVFSLTKEARGEVVTFGLDKLSDVSGGNILVSYRNGARGKRPIGITFRVDNNGSSVPVDLEGTLGIQNVYHVLSAFAVGIKEGINLVRLSESFKNYSSPPGRMKIIEGVFDTTIIDDTYNSSPVALEEALSTLKSIESKERKIAVLGDMLELGKFSESEHERIGRVVLGSAHILITVGARAKGIGKAALESGMDKSKIFEFGESKEAGKFIKGILEEGDFVLVKGSQGMRMERIVEEIILQPELKEKLLVRQEKEWQER